jgi:hypothetical protein
MSRTLYVLTSLAIVSTLLAEARAVEPGFVGVDTLLPPQQSSLLSSSAKSALSPSILPDLHLSTAVKTTPTPATATMPTFASGQIVWSSRPTSHPTSSSSNDSLLGPNPRADASPFLLTGIASQSSSPSTSAIVTPTLLRDTGTSFASPALYMPPANYLENNHPLLSH